MTSFRKSIFLSLLWICLAFLFNIVVYWLYGFDKAIEFTTGYLVEESLSIDNLFVFLLIFSYFKISTSNQHRILFWGILGALILRALFIFGGVFLVAKFHWLLYIFGFILIITSAKIIFSDEKQHDIDKSWILRLVRRFLPIAKDYNGNAFMVQENGRYIFTPLVIVLVMIETSDIIFAMDSIPAIFAITLDPFIIYTSNIFAILGLRSLYFVLAEMMNLFVYLKYGVASTFAFIGAKILLKGFYDIHVGVTLAFIVLSIGLSVLVSMIRKK